MTKTRTAVVTLGNHDGVHLGHRALLTAARERAGREGLTVTAVTFDPHPSVVLAPDRAPPLLTTIARRRELLLALGADEVTVLRFDRELASTSPEGFAEDVLARRLDARSVVVGPDFRFGRGRAGDVTALRALGEAHGFDVISVPPVTLEGEAVSSTRVRAALARGEVAEAARLLGRAHDVDGTVVRGDGRGRSIGVPTANLDCDPVLLPADGVYAVVLRVHGERELLRGVANLGVRPTFAAGRSVEVHLFDVDRDLYDARVRVGFVERLRAEQRFDGIEALKAQIARDAERARASLAAASEEAWRWI
ncbi:MAG: bifunctional riboflavin kinase/FAD synthetase [Sandaracinaceae bacterium]|nr:bifunctional riboflavin kinase/FAD synthetase [Sandaracinaceae bacterium]